MNGEGEQSNIREPQVGVRFPRPAIVVTGPESVVMHDWPVIMVTGPDSAVLLEEPPMGPSR